MNIQKSRDGLAALRSASEKASGPLRVAIDASLRVAEAAVSECESMQNSAAEFLSGAEEQFQVLDEIAESAIAKARSAEGRLEIEKAKSHRKRITKNQDDAHEAVLDAIVKVVAPLPKMLTELLYLRRFTRRLDNDRDVLTDTRKNGMIQCGNASTGEVSIVEGRAAAVALCKHFVATHETLSKIGLNVDLPEAKNPGRDAPFGAPAEFGPSSTTSLDDLDTSLGDCGPRVVDDSDD